MALLAAISLLVMYCGFVDTLLVTPVKDGILMEKNIPVRMKLVDWRITLVVDDPCPELIKYLSTELLMFKGFLDNLDSSHSSEDFIHTPYWYGEIESVQREIKMFSNGRPRRAVFDFVGKISQSLFGTATEEDIQFIKSKISKQNLVIENLVHFQDDLLTIVNVTHEEIIDNRHAINKIINFTDTLRIWIEHLTNAYDKDIHALITHQVLSEKMGTIRQHLNGIRRIYQQHEARHQSLIEGRLTKRLLPSRVLKEVASLQDSSEAELVQPQEWYYSNCRVIPVWNRHFMTYIIRVPLVSRASYNGFKINTFPVPIQYSNVTARLQTDEFVALSGQGEIMTLKRCSGEKPVVCDSPPRRKGGVAPSCGQAVVARANVKNLCDVELGVHYESLIYQQVHNHVILVTWGERITEVCSGNSNSEFDLKIGTYQLAWEGGCFLSTAHWTIAGVEQKSMAKHITILQSWNITNFNLPKIIGEANFTQNLDLPNRLSNPKIVRLNSPHYVNTDIHDHNSSSYFYYFILILIPIVIFVILIVLYFRFKKLRKEHTGNNIDDTDVNVDEPECSKNTFRLRVLTTEDSNV